ncbi:MAG: hypothetical protein ABIO71_07195, partial [Caldimonas sp.]
AGDPAFMPLPMPMHVEQSDIDARAETRSRQAQRRPSAWWWGAGLAAAAVAATPWLLSPWTAKHDADAAPATTPVAELAPVASPAASASVAVAVASAPAAIGAVLQPPAPVVAEPSAPLPATAAIAPGREPVRSAPVAHVAPPTANVAPPTANVSPLKPRLVARAEATVAPRPTPVTVRSARAAAAEAANAARLAKAHDDAAALMRARAGRGLAGPAATPDTAAAPTAFPGRGADGPTPWAVAGRPPTATAPARGAMTPTPTQTQIPTPTPTPTPTPVPVPSQPGTPVPLAVAPEVRNLPVDAAGDSDRPDWAARADEIMASYVPRVAQRAERTVSRTLFLAGRSDNVVGDVEVSSSAAQLGRTAGDVPSLVLAGREAESLAAGARNEFARRGATREAIQLQVRSFGANPLDPNGAGYLAFLLLRQRPAQAEAARQLALYALTMRGGRYPVGRPEDWTTLAVANALLGRQRDAQNALLVSLAASPSVERQCRAALDLVSLYGDRLRAPAEALLRSAQSSNARASSLCEWPPYWAATTSTR